MKTLIVYYSLTQNNEKLAKYLGEVLDCDIVKIDTLKKRTGFSIFFDLMFNRKPAIKFLPYYLPDYDHVIFVSPVWAGKVATPLCTFLMNEKVNIRQYSFITLCGGGNEHQKKKIQTQLNEIVGKSPLRVVELWIKTLLPKDKQNTVRYVTKYQIEPMDIGRFEIQIKEILELPELAAS